MTDSITIYDKNIFPIFPTVIADIKIDCGDTIRNYLNSAPMQDDNSEENTQKYGVVSKDTQILNSEVCQPFSQIILHEVLHICKTVFAYNIEGVQFTQSWVSHKEHNQYHTKHTHPNSIISGVYYWEDGDMTPISFYKNNMGASINTIDVSMDPEVSKNQPLSWDTYTIYPKKHHLIIFPSYLMHDVAVNTSPIVRKSLAFNVMPTKMLGNDGRLTQFLFGK